MVFQPGFNATEAKELLEICAILNGTRVKGDPDKVSPFKIPPNTIPEKLPKPQNWTQVYALPETLAPDYNYFEIWEHKTIPNRHVIGVRGTTHAEGSILEDIRALAIPATDKNGNSYIKQPYQFAADPRAVVHIGFSTGLISIIDEIVTQMQKFSSGVGPHEWFITGHSQGAAVATLCRSYLQYQPLLGVENITYKTYVFAQPKPGDTYYGYDYERITYDYTSQNSLGFRVTNTYDWVAQVPLSIQGLSDLSTPNILTVYSRFRFRKLGANPLLDPILVLLEKLNILTKLDYVGCGTPIILPGTYGTNTANPQDFFWQHHTNMYYKLLVEQFG
ncbi:MAG: hypothetical protein QNJ74_19130 [Trichodesmium sp. MO_231.B1]|nr:hypothetical protein [Trichodesmium sp. MO_231.B1]